MTVAISATNQSLDASIDPRFGRCQYFLLIDPDTMNFTTELNMSKGAVSGAGISAAQYLVNKGVRTIITGRVGPNAFDVLSSAGIKILTGAQGTVRETLEKYMNGQMQSMTVSQTRAQHYGMRRGLGMGRRRSGTRGYRLIQGQTELQAETSSRSSIGSSKMSRKQEIQALETRVDDIQQQLKQLKNQFSQVNEKTSDEGGDEL
jgi:predicted Fe-Mo cluster-binding NifX family protein